MNIPKTYQPQEFEKDIYAQWEEKGYFHAAPNPDKEPFCIVMPPPNITGQLHMGHALDLTIPDILIRCKRMQGYETLWLPGTDHASIATEVRIVETGTDGPAACGQEGLCSPSGSDSRLQTAA